MRPARFDSTLYIMVKKTFGVRKLYSTTTSRMFIETAKWTWHQPFTHGKARMNYTNEKSLLFHFQCEKCIERLSSSSRHRFECFITKQMWFVRTVFKPFCERAARVRFSFMKVSLHSCFPLTFVDAFCFSVLGVFGGV